VMPLAYVGTLDEHLYTALAAGCGKVPMSRSHLYEIFGGPTTCASGASSCNRTR
jgi:hypothetical protein